MTKVSSHFKVTVNDDITPFAHGFHISEVNIVPSCHCCMMGSQNYRHSALNEPEQKKKFMT